MGARGPIPKRSEQLRRRNKRDVERVAIENCGGCGAAKFVGEPCRACVRRQDR